MDLDDIPIIRDIPVIYGIARAFLFYIGLVVFPLLALVNITQLLSAKTTKSQLFYFYRTAGWICFSAIDYMIALGVPVNMFGGPDITRGEVAVLHFITLF